jgi:hypothetical protein
MISGFDRPSWVLRETRVRSSSGGRTWSRSFGCATGQPGRSGFRQTRWTGEPATDRAHMPLVFELVKRQDVDGRDLRTAEGPNRGRLDTTCRCDDVDHAADDIPFKECLGKAPKGTLGKCDRGAGFLARSAP